MINNLKTIYTGAQSEIIVKKSRFIAATHPAESEVEVIKFINSIKKEHWGAAHNCYAYCLGERNEIMRYSDDGEPSGTAGKPILDIILGREIHNAVIVVTRYFGGTLLGTGGLVRAYSQSAQEGIDQSVIITKQPGRSINVITDYNGIGKIQHLLSDQPATVRDIQYTDVVTLQIIVPIDDLDKLEKSLTDATNGKIHINRGEQIYYSVINGAVHTFEK